MYIYSLHLTNFRNFTKLSIVFDPQLTIIIGPNGSGKSNLLEAIGLLSAIRLRRVDTDLDLVHFGRDEAKIEGTIGNASKNNLTINFQVTDQYVKKAYFIDALKKRLLDFTNYLSIVVFEPSDLDLVTGSPSLRRHHLDLTLATLDRTYWRAITAYNKIVIRRNKILQRIQEGKSQQNELDFWDDRLLEHGHLISQKRRDFFEFLNLAIPSTPKISLTSFNWELKQSLLSKEKLVKNRQRDIAAGITLSGPHRDDFTFLFKNKNMEYFASRGEQRMAVLALKLAELEYFVVKRSLRPILALDDIFSELDWDHRQTVLSVIDKQQTIITAAEPESLPKPIFKKAKIVRLR